MITNMNILHIACVSNSSFNGVCVVAPLHANFQGKYVNTAFLNIGNEIIKSSHNQLLLDHPFTVSKIEDKWAKPNLVVFHEAYRLPYLSIASQLRREGIPYIIIPHGELSIRAQKKKALKKTVANVLLFNRFINNALALQCLSESERNATRFNTTKIIATNGISIPAKAKECFSENGTRFVYIGRLDAYHKGLDLMLDAVAQVADELRGKNVSINLYGPDYKGRFAHVEELISERSLRDIVSLNLAIDGQEKERILLTSDVFLQTSRFEGMPMGILEAMSYGLPCALTHGTTMGDFIEKVNAGWGAEDNADSISRMLLEVADCNKTILYEKSNLARSSVEKDFSWQMVALDAVNQYQALLQKSGK